MRQSQTRLIALLVVAVLFSQGATCRKAPRHTAHLSLNAFAKGLAGVQDAELVLYNAGKIPAGIYDPIANVCTGHACVRAKISKVASLANDAQTALDAWVPGQPAPRVLGPVMAAAKDLMRQIAALLPLDANAQAQILTVYDAITDILILVSG